MIIERTLEYLRGQLITNAPVRTNPLGAVGKPGSKNYSPYPGNLMQNGINATLIGKQATVTIGGAPAEYAPYTEATSHKKGWIKKSVEQTINMIITRYQGVRE